MASIIRIKRSEVSGNPATLAAGELAYTALADNGSNGGDRLYIGMGTETTGNAVNHVVIGGKFFTDQITASTSLATPNTLVKRDALGSIVVTNITGSVTGNADTATAWLNARSIDLTGDGTASVTGIDGTANKSAAFTLATVNSNVGQFGSATAIPIVTVNAKGLVTAITTASIATALSISGGTGSDTVSLLTDTLVFEGGTGVATTVTDNKVSFAIGQPVATTSNVTFNDITTTGTLYSNDITAANVTVDGNAIITGNLTVQGTTTTVNSTTVSVGDKNLSLAKDATTAAEADGGGITVVGPAVAATLTYTAADDRWNLNKNLNVTTVYGNVVGNATSADKWSTARNLSLTGDAAATLSSVDGTADVSATITLATVNSTIGTYGSAVVVPTFTVNAKGLVTASSETAIPNASYSTKGLASFDSDQFTVSSGAVTISMIDGGTY
jgi:hypothetical protein